MLIFGTGVVTGGLLVRNSARLPVPPQRNLTGIRPPSALSPAGMKIDFLRRMERDLNLTMAQRERIDKILGESQERTRKLMEPVSPQLREEFQQTKEQFRGVLTAEQRQAFDAMLKQQQRPNQRRSPNRTSDGPSPLAPAGKPEREQ